MTSTHTLARDCEPGGLENFVLNRVGTSHDIPAIKAIAGREKHALGFVHRGSLTRAIERDELYVADVDQSVVGFCQFYRRRDHIVTLYHIAVDVDLRGKGIGRTLLDHLHRDATDSGMVIIRLKCPVDLPSNEFYARYGFQLVDVVSNKARDLNVWALRLQ